MKFQAEILSLEVSISTTSSISELVRLIYYLLEARSFQQTSVSPQFVSQIASSTTFQKPFNLSRPSQPMVNLIGLVACHLRLITCMILLYLLAIHSKKATSDRPIKITKKDITYIC